MTREEAIDIIKCLAWHTRPDEEDVGQAIKALEQEPCEDCISRQEAILQVQRYGVGCFDVEEFSPEQCERFVISKLNSLPPVTPQPCEDAISRQAVLDIIMPYCQDDDGSVENTDDLRNALDDIEALPPVTPQPMIGHWVYDEKFGVYICSCLTDVTRTNTYRYCPNCGRKMVSE